MGNFYVNITTRKVSVNELVDFLKSKSLNAFIIEGPNDYCTIYEEICDEQNTKHISSLLLEISNQFSCPAIGMLNHDDDILAYELWLNGEKIDEYDSSPNYFDMDAEEIAKPSGGNAKLLSEHMGVSSNEEEIEKVLRTSFEEDESFVFAVDRHEALVKAVGLPHHSVGYGFRYISEGETPDEINPDNIITING
jgi:hypothetical protein